MGLFDSLYKATLSVKSNIKTRPGTALANPSKAAPENKEKAVQKNTACCIRCRGAMPLNPERPLCKSCFLKWAQYENYSYEEDYCHHCGKENDVTFAKPVCYSCYKKLYK